MAMPMVVSDATDQEGFGIKLEEGRRQKKMVDRSSVDRSRVAKDRGGTGNKEGEVGCGWGEERKRSRKVL